MCGTASVPIETLAQCPLRPLTTAPLKMATQMQMVEFCPQKKRKKKSTATNSWNLYKGDMSQRLLGNEICVLRSLVHS